MRFLAMACLAAMVACLGVAVPAQAQRDGFPPGPWRYSCRDARIQDSFFLIARCKKNDGHERDASIDLRTCPRGTQLFNDNARLNCQQVQQGGYQPQPYPQYGARSDPGGGVIGYDRGSRLPSGPWRSVCRNVSATKNHMTAECQTEKGAWRSTSLDLRDCNDNYAEVRNGRLRCW